MEDKKIPVLRGELSHNGSCCIIKVHCPYCDSFHTHGWPHTGIAPKHRVAHCKEGSPFKMGGI